MSATAGAREPGPLLAYEGVGVSIGERALLRLSRLAVGRGQVVGLVGETGSGKSLTALAAVGLFPSAAMRITGGSLRVVGQEVAGRPEREVARLRGRRVGFVFQDPLTALNPVFPVGEPLVRALALHLGLAPARARAEAVLRLGQVELPDPEAMLRRFPHELSGGQRQRVGIARALAADPLALVLDEPTSALDVLVQAQILDLLADLRRERGLGYLVISHDLSVLSVLTDRLMVMYRGRVVEEGPTARVLAEPRHPYTRALLQAVPDPSPDVAWQPRALPMRPAAGHGCAFAQRCPIVAPGCLAALPPLVAAGGDWPVACFVAHAGGGAGGNADPEAAVRVPREESP